MPGFGDLLIFVVPQVAFAIYVLLVWDARRAGSNAAADEHLGLKTVAASVAIAGVAMASTGLYGLLLVLLTFSDFMARVKSTLPDLVTGAAALIAALFVIMPRTNVAQFPKAKRLMAGAIAVGATTATLAGLSSLIREVIVWTSWDVVAQSLSMFAVAAIVLGASMGALMKMSGVSTQNLTAQPRQPGPPAGGSPGYPPQHQQSQPQQPQQQQPQQQPYPPAQQYPQQPYPPPGGQPPGGQQSQW